MIAQTVTVEKQPVLYRRHSAANTILHILFNSPNPLTARQVKDGLQKVGYHTTESNTGSVLSQMVAKEIIRSDRGSCGTCKHPHRVYSLTSKGTNIVREEKKS